MHIPRRISLHKHSLSSMQYIPGYSSLDFDSGFVSKQSIQTTTRLSQSANNNNRGVQKKTGTKRNKRQGKKRAMDQHVLPCDKLLSIVLPTPSLALAF